MTKKISARAALLAGAVWLALPIQAMAQDRENDTKEGLSGPQVHDIIVTANRQAQNLQAVSAAVQVVNGEAISQQALTNAAQIFQSTPSVQVTAQPGGLSLNIRGLGADLPSASGQGSVALEFDGIYTFTSLSATVGFFDVDRLEVLPGPQSTRYGPNADGGIVNVIAASPKLGSWDGEGTITVGNYGLVRGELAQNLPISDTLGVRVAGAFIHRNSYFKPAASNAIAQSGRIKVLWEPSDAFSARLSYQIDHLGGTGNGVEPRGISKVAPYSGDSINDDYSNPWHHGDYSTNGVDPSDNKANLKQQLFTANLSYQFSDWGAVDALGSYMRISGPQTSCYAGGAPWSVGGAKTCYQVYAFSPFNQYTGELRFHNAAGSKTIWNLGYYHWEYQTHSWSTGQSVVDPAYGSGSGTATNALYGDVIYPVTDRLRVIGGLRQSWDQRKLYPGNGVNHWYNYSSSHTDFRAGQEFDITPNSMEYLTISSGYRPGGITYSGALGDVVPYKNEVTTAIEFGLKNRFFDNRLTVNLSAFYYKQKNYQVIDSYAGYSVVLVNDSSAGSAGDTYTCTNGPNQPPECSVPTFNVQAHSFGAEAQVRFAATDNDTLSINATYLDARFDKKQGPCATVGAPASMTCPYGYNDMGTNALTFFDVAGAVQPHSPKLAARFAYEHVFHLGGLKLAAGGDAFYSSSYWVHPVQDTNGYGYQPAYWLENLHLNLSPEEGRWSLNAFVRNLSGYAVKQSVLPITTIGDPRTFGASFNYKW